MRLRRVLPSPWLLVDVSVWGQDRIAAAIRTVDGEHSRVGSAGVVLTSLTVTRGTMAATWRQRARACSR